MPRFTWETAPAARAMGRFGCELQRQREAREMSQSRLAALCGYDHSYVSRLEQAKREPSRDTVAALCAVLAIEGEEAARLFLAAGYVPPGSRYVEGADWGVWLLRKEAPIAHTG